MTMNLTLIILFLLPAVFTVVTIVVTRVYIKSQMLRLKVSLGNSLITAVAVVIIVLYWGVREALAYFALQMIVALSTSLRFPARKYPPRNIHT